MDPLEKRLRLLEEAEAFGRELEERLEPLEELRPTDPFVFISLGGGELGDLMVTAARTILGGARGGVLTVTMDRYEGFPAQDSSDYSEVLDLLNGAELRRAIKKYVPRPRERKHAICLEIERIDTATVARMGIEEGYNIVSTPYAPLVGMDRVATKLLMEKLKIPMVEWRYASNEEELRRAAKELGLPVIVKPVMTSSGHGTTIVKTSADLERAYEYALRHARGRGDEVVVEEYLEELKTEGLEVTQLVLRHFDEKGSVVSSELPPVEHQRPGATYHESWLPPTLQSSVRESCRQFAKKIADFFGGLGIYAVEQFAIRGRVYNSEFANRPHDTGMVTKWAMSRDEGALHLLASMGLPIGSADLSLSLPRGFAVAHVVLAPQAVREGARVLSWRPSAVKAFAMSRGYSADLWYFGKPTAYPGRRMGLAVAFHEDLAEARRIAEEVAHFAEGAVIYEG
ncbi:MAG: ATP-grasp domain-containing protein [Fervidicoccaceae archaeon]